MADPQLERGHLRVANDLWEAWTRADLTARQLRVLLAITRLSYGWRRLETSAVQEADGPAPASRSVLARMTGLDPAHISGAVRGLLQKQLVRLVSPADPQAGRAPVYRVVKDYDSWSPAVLPGSWRPGVTPPGPNQPRGQNSPGADSAPPPGPIQPLPPGPIQPGVTDRFYRQSTPPRTPSESSSSCGARAGAEQEPCQERSGEAEPRKDLDAAELLARVLRDAIREHDPSAAAGRRGDDKLSSWARAIRRVLERGRSPDLVERVIRWATAEPYWTPIVDSGARLEKHFDALKGQMERGDGGRAGTGSTPPRRGSYGGVRQQFPVETIPAGEG